ncbi:MAG: PKD domain-containing protein [Patescibacteria group bacterium]
MRFNTKYLLLVTLFAFSLPFFVLAGDISQVVFINDPRAIKPNETALLTIQLQYEGDSHPTACMQMFTDSSTGQFSSSDTNWKSVDKLTINSNWTNKNFYYKDSVAGNYTITIKIIPVSCSSLTDEEAQWTASQNITVSESTSSQSAQSSTENNSQSTTVVDLLEEPQIYANAGEDKTIVAGADIEFRGQALGLKKEPLDNARYLWSFGDGATKEGQNVLHSYKYPAEYIVTLDVSSGKYSASDRVMVKVVPNKISISEATSEFIKLKNGSDATLDISGWFLKGNGILFKIPENTFIKTNAEVPISSLVSGINTINTNSEILFLYPNGSMAFSYTAQRPEIVFSQEAQKPQEKSKTEKKDDNQLDIITESSQLESVPVQQTASIIDSISEDSWEMEKWLFVIFGVGFIGGAGVIFLRRNFSKDKKIE